MSMKKALLPVSILLAITLAPPMAHAGVESSYFDAPKNIEAGTEFKVAIRANLSKDEHSSCYVKSALSYSGNLKLVKSEAGNYPSPITFQQNLQTINMTTGECKSEGYTGSYTLAVLTFTASSEGKATVTSKAWKNNDIEVNGSVAQLSPFIADITPSQNNEAGPRFQGVTVTPYAGAIKIIWSSNVPAKDVKLAYNLTDQSKISEQTVKIDSPKSYSATIENLNASSSYNFTLTGTAEDGTPLRYDGYTTTKGYPVRIFVEQGGEPLANASIVIDDYTYKTDSEGIYSADMPPGNISVRVESDGQTARQTFQVVQSALQDGGMVVDRQEFTISLPAPKETAAQTPVWLFVTVGIAVLLAVAGSVVAFLFVRKKRKQQLVAPNPDVPAPPSDIVPLP